MPSSVFRVCFGDARAVPSISADSNRCFGALGDFCLHSTNKKRGQEYHRDQYIRSLFWVTPLSSSSHAPGKKLNSLLQSFSPVQAGNTSEPGAFLIWVSRLPLSQHSAPQHLLHKRQGPRFSTLFPSGIYRRTSHIRCGSLFLGCYWAFQHIVQKGVFGLQLSKYNPSLLQNYG